MIAFSPDGKLLASASADKTIRLWDVAKEKCRAILAGHSNEVSVIAFSPDGKLLASVGYDNQLRLWDVGAGKEIALLSKQMGSWNLVFSPDSKSLFVEAVDSGCFWDISSLKMVKKIKMRFGERSRLAPHSLAYDADGRLLGVVWHPDRTSDVWDVLACKSLRTLEYPEKKYLHQCVAFGPSGREVALADRGICLWNVRTGKRIVDYEHRDTIYSLAFRPDGKLIATAWRPDSDIKQGTIMILDPASGKELAILKGHTGPIHCVTFSPDGTLLASASSDRTIKLWDVRGVKAPKKD